MPSRNSLFLEKSWEICKATSVYKQHSYITKHVPYSLRNSNKHDVKLEIATEGPKNIKYHY